MLPTSPRLRFALVAFPALAVAYALGPFLGIAAMLTAAPALPATARRLRETRLPVGLAPLLFVPFANGVFAVVLALVPLADAESPPSRVARVVPGSTFGSAAAGVVLTAALGAGMTFVAANVLGVYGFALFLAVPFCLGLFSSLVFGLREDRTLEASMVVGVVAVAVASAALIVVSLEGAICVVMALPLTISLGIAGAVLGYHVQRRRGPASGVRAASAAVLLLPALMGVEALTEREPPLRVVTTHVVVDASPAIVWRHVVAIDPLPPPRELVFRLGIAYPTRATLDGRGVGAVRRCTFTTGDFVEPITVWKPERRLEFAVRAQPPPMKELSPYADVHAPHLDGFLRSERGRFELVPLPGGKTLLRGTTWYRNRMWPAAYWGLWSDALIRTIHRRVLRHVEHVAERRRAPRGYSTYTSSIAYTNSATISTNAATVSHVNHRSLRSFGPSGMTAIATRRF